MDELTDIGMPSIYLIFDSHETVEAKKLIRAFIRGQKQGKSYLTLKDINELGRLQIHKEEMLAEVDKYPFIFFSLSTNRYILTLWLFEAIRVLFPDASSVTISITELHSYLKDYFGSKVSPLARLVELFIGRKEVTTTLFRHLMKVTQDAYHSVLSDPLEDQSESSDLDKVEKKSDIPAYNQKEISMVVDWIIGDERNHSILIDRALGASFAVISRKHGLTRERIRQLVQEAILKAGDELNTNANAWAGFVSNNPMGPAIIYSNAIIDALGKDNWTILKYLIKEAKPKRYYYWESQDLVIYNADDELIRLLEGPLERSKGRINKEDIGTWLETIKSKGLGSLSEEVVHRQLIGRGYKKTGDSYLQESRTIREAAALLMPEISNEVFKITDANDTDRMRKLISEKGARISKNDRSFWAAVTESMVLCGRGMYCSPARIKVEAKLMDDILSYIDKHLASGIYYKTLYQVFKKRLLNESNIDNYHFLHGVLMLFYPNRYVYAKDYIYSVENTAAKMTSAKLFNDYLMEKGRPASKKEILSKFKELSVMQINYAQSIFPQILHWDENTYIHASALHLDRFDEDRVARFLMKEFQINHGYSSAYRLYEWLKLEASDIVDKFGIGNEVNGYRLVEYVFKDKYAFSYPHIVQQWNLGKRFTTIDLVNRLAIDKESISRLSLQMDAANIVGKQIPSLYYAIRDFCFTMIRIDEDRYIKPSGTNNLEEIKKYVNYRMDTLLRDYDVIVPALNADWEKGLPPIGHQWNQFIVGSIIDLYLPAYRVIGKSVSAAASYAFVKQKSLLMNKKDVLLWLINKHFTNNSAPGEINNFIDRTQLFRKLKPRITWIEEVPTISGTYEKDDN